MEIPAIFYVSVITISAILGIVYLYFIIRQNNEDFSRAERIILFAMPLSLIFGRIGYVLLNVEEFMGNLSGIFLFWEGGVNLPIALISFFILAFSYSEVHALKAMFWFDMLIIPMIFAAAVHELSLYFLFEKANEFIAEGLQNVTIGAVGFSEREFLQLPALFEGIFTLVLAIVLTRIKKYDSGAIFFLGASCFYFIRFVSTFFFVVSTPMIFNSYHIFLLMISIIFIALFLFTVKTQRGKK